MKVLVIGSGAREHALCLALSYDPAVNALMCAPGNAGTVELAEARPVDVLDPVAVADLAEGVAADLTVVGPEGPLVAGVADELRRRQLPVFGPNAAAARIEGSKAFAKSVMDSARVPTAAYFDCSTPDEVAAALDEVGPPYVVKDDGLAAGKGVVVTDDRAVAMAHAEGKRVVIEEYLPGPEVSLFAITDGRAVVPLMPAQDFKRALDYDLGPNTGGMGAYSPLTWAPPNLVEEVLHRVLLPTVTELRERGAAFSGLLYAGLALTEKGPKVIEFNARFGDPETQVVLARLATPIAAVFAAAADGTLAGTELDWRLDASVTVVMAAAGYPGEPRSGDVISGLEKAASLPGVDVLHSGTRREGADVVTSGGRVLSVTARGRDLGQARERAYEAVSHIAYAGAHYRRDIAERAARGEVTV